MRGEASRFCRLTSPIFVRERDFLDILSIFELERYVLRGSKFSFFNFMGLTLGGFRWYKLEFWKTWKLLRRNVFRCLLNVESLREENTM